MSRHELDGRNGATRVAVGWDRPLNTFYAQAFRVEDGEEVAFVWKGTSTHELPTAGAALAVIADYADPPPDLARTLETDRLRSLGTADGPAQTDAKRRLFGGPR